MFYKILVKGRDLGVVGHCDIENIRLSISGDADRIYLSANAAGNENGKQYYYLWPHEEIGLDDRVEIVPTETAQVREPLKKFLMAPTFKRRVAENIICDFCYRDETEAGEMIHLDEHRPTICSECVQVCANIFEQWERKG